MISQKKPTVMAPSITISKMPISAPRGSGSPFARGVEAHALHFPDERFVRTQRRRGVRVLDPGTAALSSREAAHVADSPVRMVHNELAIPHPLPEGPLDLDPRAPLGNGSPRLGPRGVVNGRIR